MGAIEGGTVEIKDYYTHGRAPYRYATVTVLASREDLERRAAELSLLAFDVEGHATVHTHYAVGTERGAAFSVSLSRDLAEEELRQGEEVYRTVSFPVAIADVVQP